MNTSRMLGTGGCFDHDDQGPESQGTNPLVVVHSLLQGRYWMTAAVAGACIAAGCLLGFKIPQRAFACTGTIHIKPVLANPLFDKNGMMPMYESYVQTQVARLKSEGVIENALSSQEWLDQGANGHNRSNSPLTMEAFRKHLDVVREGELIRVTFTDTEPKTASDGVSAVINAYAALGIDGVDSPSKQLAQIESLRDEYQRRVRASDDKIEKLAGDEGPEGIKMQYSMQLAVTNQAKTEWELAQSALDLWQATHSAAVEPADDDDAPPAALTAEDIARRDQAMAQLLQTRDTVKRDLNELSQHLGPASPAVVDDQRHLQVLESEIRERVANWKPYDTGGTPASGAMTLEQMQAGEEAAHRRYDTAHAEVIRLAEITSKIHAAEAGQQQDRELLDRTKHQIEELRVEAAQSGRIEQWPISTPALKDYRVPIAAASGFGGGLLGVGVMLLLGLTDRRLRTVDQARLSVKHGGGSMRVLGMLPTLPRNLEDPSAASFAALCVHHIRMLLQVMPQLDAKPAIAVTSPSSGDGKTSLTLALALSYAAAGKNTLLIDCDIVGAGLTRRINAIIRRRVGQILIRDQLITPPQLREALVIAQRTGRKLGEVLVDEGFVDAQQLATALKMQGETSVGLLDVLRGESLEDCVADTGTARLSILPVGSALAEHGATISPEGFRAVLEQARQRYDAILIDTGPIPGSIESSVAASQADGVVLTVSRNEQGPLVRRASEHLREIGARALGLVFNRATPEDFAASAHGAMSSRSVPERIRERPGTDLAQFGPVAAAVASQGKN